MPKEPHCPLYLFFAIGPHFDSTVSTLTWLLDFHAIRHRSQVVKTAIPATAPTVELWDGHDKEKTELCSLCENCGEYRLLQKNDQASLANAQWYTNIHIHLQSRGPFGSGCRASLADCWTFQRGCSPSQVHFPPGKGFVELCWKVKLASVTLPVLPLHQDADEVF